MTTLQKTSTSSSSSSAPTSEISTTEIDVINKNVTTPFKDKLTTEIEQPEPSPTFGSPKDSGTTSDDVPKSIEITGTPINKLTVHEGLTDSGTTPREELKQDQKKLASNIDGVARPVRLFVGQVPESMLEPQISQLFASIGIKLMDIAIIRDRHTGRHRHCAFVTVPSREAADIAIAEFHNSRYLHTMANPMQVKEANQPKSKAAYAAMRAYSQMFGTPMPSFAQQSSPPSSKTTYRQQPTFTSFVPMPPFLQQGYMQQMPMHVYQYGSGVPPYLYGYVQPVAQQVNMNVSPVYPYQAQGSPVIFTQQNVSGGANQQESLPKITSSISIDSQPFTPASMKAVKSQSSQPDEILLQASGLSSTRNEDAHTSGNKFHGNKQLSQDSTVGYAYQTSTPFLYNAPESFPTVYSVPMARRPLSPAYVEGPPGANLFVNNLPEHFTDDDLFKLFSPIGTVLSHKVFIDKFSNKSKGFGFVSFDDESVAQRAIQEKNGYEVEPGRQILVELKRPRRKLQDFY